MTHLHVPQVVLFPAPVREGGSTEQVVREVPRPSSPCSRVCGRAAENASHVSTLLKSSSVLGVGTELQRLRNGCAAALMPRGLKVKETGYSNGFMREKPKART